MKFNHEMSAEASSSMQVSTKSYKTAEEYPTSDIPDLGSHMYPQLTCTWNNSKMLKAMSSDMPIVNFLADVPEPKYPPLPVHKPSKSATLYLACTKVAYEEIKNSQISAWLEVVHKAKKKEKEEREQAKCAEKERVEKEWVEKLKREHEEHAHVRRMMPVAGGEDDRTYETPCMKRTAESPSES
ncbi:hypothetical protein Moror_14881, partial [Moniliophthora roreri MCA 2997]